MKIIIVVLAVCVSSANALAWNPFEKKADVLREQRKLEEVRAQNQIDTARAAQTLEMQRALLQMQTEPYDSLRAQLRAVQSESRNRYVLLCSVSVAALVFLMMLVWNIQRLRFLNAEVRSKNQDYAKLYRSALTLQNRLMAGKEIVCKR